MRVGDAERSACTDLLLSAARDGRLDPLELDERLEAVRAARWTRDLRVLLEDLPDDDGAAHALVGHGTVGGGPRLALGLGGRVVRSGAWPVPPHLELRAGLGRVHLDYTRATVVHRYLHLDVALGAGSLGIVVPRTWWVDAGGLRVDRGTVALPRPTTDRPQVVLALSGRAGLARVRVRTASRWRS